MVGPSDLAFAVPRGSSTILGARRAGRTFDLSVSIGPSEPNHPVNPINSSIRANLRILVEVDRVDASRTRSPHPPLPRLTVVIVNYNGWSDVLPLLETLGDEPELLSGACQVVVVDNGSSEPTPRSPNLRRTGVDLALRPDNGGFAVGVNAGWRKSRGDWILLLNPDVEIEAGTLGRILGRIDAWETRPEGAPGIVGFGLRNADGTAQGSVGAFPNFGRFMTEQLRPRSRRKYVAPGRLRPGSVDWVTGACMVLNSRMMAELGGMDEDFFLYHEEVALCRVAHDQGWAVEHDPSVQVVHRHPLQNRPISPKMRVIIRHAKLLYFLKHVSRRQFLALARVIELEAIAKSAWAFLRRQPKERGAWGAIRRMAVEMRKGGGPRGVEVLVLAENVERSKETRPPPRPLSPGRDGPKSRVGRPKSMAGTHDPDA